MVRAAILGIFSVLALTGGVTAAADDIVNTRLGAAFGEIDTPVAARTYEDLVAVVPLTSGLEANRPIRIGCENVFLRGDAPVKGVRVQWQASTVAYGRNISGGFVMNQIAKGRGRSDRSGRIYQEFDVTGPIVRDASHFFQFEVKYRGKKLLDDTAVVCAWTDAVLGSD